MEPFTPPPPPPRSLSSVRPLFFWRWILANSIGIIAGFILLIIHSIIKSSVISNFFLLGLTVGVMQWLVLRKYLNKMREWVVATVVGFLIGLVLFFQSLRFSERIFLGTTPAYYSYLLFLGLILGFILGISQWLVLRKKVYRSQWWILANTITGGLICLLISYSLSSNHYNNWLGSWLVLDYNFRLALGVGTLSYLPMITLTMFFLLKHPKMEVLEIPMESPPAPLRSLSPVGLLFFLWWILANSIGIIAGFMLLIISNSSNGYIINFLLRPFIPFPFEPFILSLTVGIMQWLVLKEYLNKMRWWVFATVVGFFLSLALVLLSAFSFVVFGWVIFMPFGWNHLDPDPAYYSYLPFFQFSWGLPLGISQWLVLRKKVYRSQWWILATTITVGLIFHLMGYFGSNNYNFFLALGVCILVYLLIPSTTMFFLLKRPKRE